MTRASRRPSCVASVQIALCLTLVLAIGDHCQAGPQRGDPDARYLAGLRNRRLFSLAERYCQHRLADPALTPSYRVLMTVELSQCFAEHATWRSGREQEELWQRAESVVTELLSGESEPSRRGPLVLQAANVAAAYGTWLRWRSELSPYDATLRQQAIAQLQAARETLRQAESSLTHPDRTGAQAAAIDLRQVSADARFQTAVTSLDLARLLPTGIERTAALYDADTRLTELSRNPFFESRRTVAKLLLATTARLRDDHNDAMKLLDALSSGDLPVPVRQQAAAESMRVELDRGNPDAALLQLAEVERATGGLSDELLCVGVEARLAARLQSLQSGDAARAATLLEEAVAVDARIQGPWRARSSALLEQTSSAGEYGAELAPLILASRAAQQHDDTDASVARYREATQAARRSGRDDLASELQFTAASLLLQAGRYEEAGQDFVAVAEAASPAARTAEAHLLFAYCRGKQWEARPTQANRESYAAALDDHLLRFKDEQTRIEATWMLAAYHEARLQWTEALALYESIPATHARASAGRVRMAALYEQILDRLQQAGQPRDEWEDRALVRLAEAMKHLPPPPAPLAIVDAEAVLGFARILLDHRQPDYASCDNLLKRVIDNAQVQALSATPVEANIGAQWQLFQQSAERLLIVSLAGQGLIDEARQSLESLAAADPQSALGVLDGLSEIALSAAPDRRAVLGELQLQAVAEVEPLRTTLTPEQQQRLDSCLAQAFVAVGRPNDAARAYRRLLERMPDDKQLLTRAAHGIAGLETPDALREAKSLWRRLEGLETPGSRAWLTARLEVARCCQQFGEIDECRKLLGVTRLLYPELGGPELKARFDELDAAIKMPQ